MKWSVRLGLYLRNKITRCDSYNWKLYSLTVISDRGANMQIIKPEFHWKAFNMSDKRSRLTKRATAQSYYIIVLFLTT